MADQDCTWLSGCRSKSVGAGLDCAAYRLYTRSVCETKAPLQLRYAALCKCYTRLPKTGTPCHTLALCPWSCSFIGCLAEGWNLKDQSMGVCGTEKTKKNGLNTNQQVHLLAYCWSFVCSVPSKRSSSYGHSSIYQKKPTLVHLHNKRNDKTQM